MEADLHHYYGVDLLDMWRPNSALTLRKVWVLITRLPDKSNTSRALNGGRERWSLTEYLLADLWALFARWLWGKDAPDAHPWREIENKHNSTSRKQAKRQLLLEKQRKYGKTRGRRGGK